MTTAVTLFFLFSIGEKTGNFPDNDTVNLIVRIDFKKWKEEIKSSGNNLGLGSDSLTEERHFHKMSMPHT